MKTGSILVHCCCAHCTAYTIEHWRRQSYRTTALWYNPNIHPYMEHQQRLEAMRSLAKNMEFPLIIIGGYDIVDYFRRVVGDEVNRCRFCFDMRLFKTAESALRMGYDAFTTTLLISHQQKHDLLQEIGSNIAEKMGVEFMYADLRKRYSDSRRITKPMNLYRQQYCGCVYSEWERYADVKIE